MEKENKSKAAYLICKKSAEYAKLRQSSMNFNYLYDSFHQPLTDIISNEGEMVGIDRKGELKHFSHTEESQNIEAELSKYAESKDIELLDLKLAEYFVNQYEDTTEPLKYILFFYKVFFTLLL